MKVLAIFTVFSLASAAAAASVAQPDTAPKLARRNLQSYYRCYRFCKWMKACGWRSEETDCHESCQHLLGLRKEYH